MHGAPFYEAGNYQAKGIRRGVVAARRVLRRLLRPMLLQLDAEMKAIAHRQDQLDRQLKAAVALGWDHVAMARRLAVLEDHVEALLARDAATLGDPAADGVPRPSILYPGPETARGGEPRPIVAPKARVI